jgi:hypothetical protein
MGDCSLYPEETFATGGRNLLSKLVKPRHTVRQCITSTAANHRNPSLTKPDYSTAKLSGSLAASTPWPWTARLRRSRCNFQCNNSPLFAANSRPNNFAGADATPCLLYHIYVCTTLGLILYPPHEKRVIFNCEPLENCVMGGLLCIWMGNFDG